MTDEDKAAAEKDAVKSMIGAMTAMQGAQERIRRLEEALKACDYMFDMVQRGVGENLKIDIYRDGGWKVTGIHAAIQDRRDMIKKVL